MIDRSSARETHSSYISRDLDQGRNKSYLDMFRSEPTVCYSSSKYALALNQKVQRIVGISVIVLGSLDDIGFLPEWCNIGVHSLL
jgi:hypothetical protein